MIDTQTLDFFQRIDMTRHEPPPVDEPGPKNISTTPARFIAWDKENTHIKEWNTNEETSIP